jgi:hypothetical protein
MSNTIKEELADLASEIDALRLAGRKNWFPKAIWEKAAYLSQKIPDREVCEALGVKLTYFRKKISSFNSIESEKLTTFVEVPTIKYGSPSFMTVNIQTPAGYKLTIGDVTPSCLTPILEEFLKGGLSCCK